MSIQIEPLTAALLPEARDLVRRVFPWQGPFEWLSFWMYANQGSPPARALMAVSGVSEVIGYWVATDDHTGRVLGTTGLYSYARDASEAVWLAWFCVAPEARRRGIGSELLDFSIAEARRTERRYLRLYTSDVENEAAAQCLYESRGLVITHRKHRLLYTKIYRELPLG